MMLIASLVVAQSMTVVAAESGARVTFEYSDIDRFNDTRPALAASDDRGATLQARYIDAATPALRQYIDRYGLSTDKWLEAIDETPRYFASLDNLPARLAAQEQEIEAAYQRFRDIYPTDKPMHVNYVVGPMVAGGIQDASGVIIAAEVYGLSGDTDMSEFNSRRRMFSPQDITPIVIHEFVHSLQVDVQGRDTYLSIYGDKKSLLAIAIREGSADFLASLAAGETMNNAAHEFGNRREAELWALFKEDMLNAETGDWLFYTPKEHPDWPVDLGYFMGYKITEAFYRTAADKRQAIDDILGVTDYAGMVKRSGYNPR
jgi:hypothetical protein